MPSMKDVARAMIGSSYPSYPRRWERGTASVWHRRASECEWTRVPAGYRDGGGRGRKIESNQHACAVETTYGPEYLAATVSECRTPVLIHTYCHFGPSTRKVFVNPVENLARLKHLKRT